MRVPTIAEASLTVRDDRDQLIQNAAKDVSPDVIGDAKPYWTFRWYLGQRHYSGSYWSSTESTQVPSRRGHVAVPSRTASTLSLHSMSARLASTSRAPKNFSP
jgi:hypothetical protein